MYNPSGYAFRAVLRLELIPSCVLPGSANFDRLLHCITSEVSIFYSVLIFNYLQSLVAHISGIIILSFYFVFLFHRIHWIELYRASFLPNFSFKLKSWPKGVMKTPRSLHFYSSFFRFYALKKKRDNVLLSVTYFLFFTGTSYYLLPPPSLFTDRENVICSKVCKFSPHISY